MSKENIFLTDIKAERIISKVDYVFVHREATSKYHKGFEKLIPNPDKDKGLEPMYLKNPRKLPKRLFEPYNEKLVIHEQLKDRYNKNVKN